MKAKSQVGALIGASAIALVALGGVSYIALDGAGAQIDESFAKIALHQKNIQVANEAHVTFQRQVQEWKNILVRGDDREDYEKYMGAFEKNEKAMREKVTVLKENFAKVGYPTESADAILTAHKNIGERYRLALTEHWTDGDPVTGKRVDITLRGIDRDISKRMDDLSKSLNDFSTKQMTSISESIKSELSDAITKLLGVLVGGVGVVLALGTMVVRSVKTSGRKE